MIELSPDDEVKFKGKVRVWNAREHFRCLAPGCHKYIRVGRTITCSQECVEKLLDTIGYLAQGAYEDASVQHTGSLRFARRLAEAAEAAGKPGPGEGQRESGCGSDVPAKRSVARRVAVVRKRGDSARKVP